MPRASNSSIKLLEELELELQQWELEDQEERVDKVDQE